MVLYALASKTQFFRICSSGINSIKELHCPIETISDLCKESQIYMVAHPLTPHSCSEMDSSFSCIIQEMRFDKSDAVWDVLSTSVEHYRLLV